MTYHTNLQWVQPITYRFNKINGFIRVRGGEFRHLVLFGHGFFDTIFDKIKYLRSEKSDIADSINHNFGKIIISYNTRYNTH